MARFAGLLVCVALFSGLAVWWTGAWSTLVGATRLEEPAAKRTAPTASAGTASAPTASPGGTQAAPQVVNESGAPAEAGSPFHDPVVISGCALAPAREQDVASQVDGVFAEVAVELGTPVVRGQLLGRLDASHEQLLVQLYRLKATSELAEKLAQAKLNEAEAWVQGDEQLRQTIKGGVSDAQYRLHVLQRDEAALEIKKAREDRQGAELELKRVERDLKLHEVRSDLAGQVVKVYKRYGEAIKQWEPAFRVADFGRLRVEGLVPVQQAELLRVGLHALVHPEVPIQPVTELRGHTGAIADVALSPDSRWLATAGEDRTLCVWSVGQAARRSLLTEPTEVSAVAWGPQPDQSGYRLASATVEGGARLWRVGRDGHVEPHAVDLQGGHHGPIRCADFSADGRWLATGADDKKIALWDVANGKLRAFVSADGEVTAHHGPVTMVHFSPDGTLVSAGRDNAIRLWQVDPRPRLLAEQGGRTGDIPRPGVSADGRLLFDHGEELRILRLGNWSAEGTLTSNGHGRFQGLAVLSPSGRRVLTAAANGRLQLWKTPVPEQAARNLREGYRHGISRDAFTRLGASLTDGGPFAAALLAPWMGDTGSPALLGSNQLWPLDACEVRRLAASESAGVTCGAFTADESTAFTAGADGVVRVWTLPPLADDQTPLEAVVTFIGSQVEGNSGLVRVRAELENPSLPERRLRPGTSVSLTLYPETALLTLPRP